MGKKLYVLYAALAIVAGGAIYMFFLNLHSKSPTSEPFVYKIKTPGTQHPNKSVGHLYFSDKENSFLIAEERSLVHSDAPAEFGSIIIDALIKGPRQDLMRTIPEDTTLRALYVTQDKTAYVDLSEAVKEHHPGGSKSELITIYSIVNSLILNIPQIDTVKILVGGRETTTLAGHVDLRFPFQANMLLIR